MKSVGGLSVGLQDKNPNLLRISGDVSGLKAFSHKPTGLNSCLAVKKVEAIVKDSLIQIYVVTTLYSDSYNSSEITGVNIRGAKRGKYMVQYLNPDGSVVYLREVEIY